MSRKGHGQIRQSQVITTYGPGALIDLPRHSAIVGGLDTWPSPGSLDEITEPRLTRKLGTMTGVPLPRLYAPPPEPNEPWAPARGIGAWRFPEWFVVQEAGGGERPERSRRLVHRKGLDERGRFDRLPDTIRRDQGGERPVKQVELEALLRAPEGFGDDMPIDPDFHARRLPDAAWRRSEPAPPMRKERWAAWSSRRGTSKTISRMR